MRARIKHFLKGDTLDARAARSSVLTVINFGGQNVIRLLSNLILTRLLFPEAFGLMALVMVVVVGVQLLSDIGIRDAVVQNERGNSPEFLNTAWVINIARGFILWLATILLAAPVAEFYDAPQLAQLLPVAGMTAAINGFSSTRVLFADRNLMLGRLTVMFLGGQVLGILVMIVLAWWFQSIWALVVGMLVTTLSTTVLSHLILPGTPDRFAFDPAVARKFINFGKYIFLSTVAGYVISQADRAVLGKFVSLDDLAIYNIGLTMAMVPVLLTQALSSRILFPIYARRPPSESVQSRRKINHARRILTGGVLLGTAVLAVSGVALMELLYDPRYEASGAFVVLISLAAIPTIITFSYHRLTTAAGDTSRFAFLNISIALLQLGALLVGIRYFGMGGAVMAPAVATLVFYPALVALIWRYKGWDPLHDALYFTGGLVITSLVVWLHGPALWPLFAPL